MAITVEDAKDQLNITSSVHDVELEGYVDSAMVVVERHTGRTLVQRDFTEQRIAGGALALTNTPVVALISVQSVDGVTVWNVADLHVDPDTGLVRAVAGPAVTGHVTVEYTAGYAEDGAPSNYDLAALIIVQHLWETQRGTGGLPEAGGLEDTLDVAGMTARRYAIPNRALELLGSPPPVVA